MDENEKKDVQKQPDLFGDMANAFGSFFSSTVTNVSNAVQDGSKQFGEYLDKKSYENDRKTLCPFFREDLAAETFVLPTMIRIVDYDKRRENRACEGSIGFMTTTPEMNALNIYTEFAPMLNITFYPFLREGAYYVDPCHPDFYISLDEYFSYLKKVRVDELEMIAQDLGAKHIKIVLKEQRKNSAKQSDQVNVGVNGFKLFGFGFNGSYDSSNSETTSLEVAAEIDFAGHSTPVEPKPVYFKHESDINSLIRMRMTPGNENKILSKTYSFKYSNSSGISVKEAVKIDAVIKKMNCDVGVSILNEATFENGIILEYSIAF